MRTGSKLAHELVSGVQVLRPCRAITKRRVYNYLPGLPIQITSAMEGISQVLCFFTFITMIQAKGDMLTGTQVEGLNECVGDTIHMRCPPGHRIHILQVFYGQSSQGCSYDPKGCVRQDSSFHRCTGQEVCDWTVPIKRLQTCGEADYVSVTKRCLPEYEITDLCSVETLTNSSGYLASPGYPGPPASTKITCKLTISLSDPQEIINFYMYDLGNGDCRGSLIIKEANKPRPRSLRLCSSSIRSRGQRIYTSYSNVVELTYNSVSDSSSGRGFLIYYQAQKKTRSSFPSEGIVVQTPNEATTTKPAEDSTNAKDTEPGLEDAKPIPSPRTVSPDNGRPGESAAESARRRTEEALRRTLLLLLGKKREATTLPTPSTKLTTITNSPVEVVTEPTNIEKIKPTIVSTPAPKTELVSIAYIEDQDKSKSEPKVQATTTERFLSGQINYTKKRETLSPTPTTETPTTERTTVIHVTPKGAKEKVKSRVLITKYQAPTTQSTMPQTTPKKTTTTTKRTTKVVNQGDLEKSTKQTTPTASSSSSKMKIDTSGVVYDVKNAQASISELTTAIPAGKEIAVLNGTTHDPFSNIFARDKPRDSGPWAAIVGGVIASIAGILLLVIIGIMIWEKRKKKCARTRMYDDVVITNANNRARQELGQQDQGIQRNKRFPIPRNRIYENVQINGGFIPDEVCLKKTGNSVLTKENSENDARSGGIGGQSFGQMYQNTDMSCGEETDAERSYDEVSMQQTLRMSMTSRPVPAKRQSVNSSQRPTTASNDSLDVGEDVYCEIADNSSALGPAGKPMPPVRTASRRDPPNMKPPKPPIKPKPKGSLKRWLDKATGRHKEPEVSPDSLIDVQMVENEVYESEEIRKS